MKKHMMAMALIGLATIATNSMSAIAGDRVRYEKGNEAAPVDRFATKERVLNLVRADTPRDEAEAVPNKHGWPLGWPGGWPIGYRGSTSYSIHGTSPLIDLRQRARADHRFRERGYDAVRVFDERDALVKYEAIADRFSRAGKEALAIGDQKEVRVSREAKEQTGLRETLNVRLAGGLSGEIPHLSKVRELVSQIDRSDENVADGDVNRKPEFSYSKFPVEYGKTSKLDINREQRFLEVAE